MVPASVEQAPVVTPEFFRATGVQPLVGRLFSEGEFEHSSVRVAVLGHELWTERFAESPTIIGQSIEIDGRWSVIVGITTNAFNLPDNAQLWMPMSQ